MLFDFESQTTSTPTKHGAATARELYTPVKLITFSMVDKATSPFAHHKKLRPLQKKQQQQSTKEPQIWDKVVYLTQTS